MHYSTLSAAAVTSALVANAAPMAQNDNTNGVTRAIMGAIGGIANIGVLAGSAAGSAASTNQNKAVVTMYWGGGVGEKDLASYCGSDGPDYILLNAVNKFGQGQYSIQWMGGCMVNDGTPDGDGCTNLAKDIATCQKNGKKVLLSIGGAPPTDQSGGHQELDSTEDAQTIGAKLFNAFGKPGDVKDKSVLRPFGDGHVDGFDVNYENNNKVAADHLADLVNGIRNGWGSSTDYVISGAPMNGLPDEYMGKAWANAKFDIMQPQFFNGGGNANTYFTNKNTFAYDAWAKALDGTASQDAKMLIGLPASDTAATGAKDDQWIEPDQLVKLTNDYKTHARYGGVMLWQASEGDKAITNGHNYWQQVRCIVDTGKVC